VEPTFCTLMPWDVELNIRLAFMALANFLALLVSEAAGELKTNLAGNLLLLVDWEVDKRIVLGADQEGDGRLVEATPLAIPLLDAVQRALARQVEHEEDGNRVVADQRQHVDELALPAQVPD
jgi:hypothetical protein